MAVCSSALRSTSTRLLPGRLDCLSTATQPWYGAGQRNTELGWVFTACCRALGKRVGKIRGDNLTTLERCSVSFSLSRFRRSAFSAQRPGTNGGMQWCYSLLVMLESQRHISFCVRDLIAFVCHCRQINCGVVWRTESPPYPPSPSSVPPDSHHSLLARVYLPLLSCPPLSAKLCLACSPAPYCLRSPFPRSFKVGSPLFNPSRLLHDLLENSLPESFQISSLQQQDVPSRGLILIYPLSLSPSPSLSWSPALWPSPSCSLLPPSPIHPCPKPLSPQFLSPPWPCCHVPAGSSLSLFCCPLSYGPWGKTAQQPACAQILTPWTAAAVGWPVSLTRSLWTCAGFCWLITGYSAFLQIF